MRRRANTLGEKILIVLMGLAFIASAWTMNQIDTNKKNETNAQVLSSYVTHKKIRSRNHKRRTSYLPVYHYEINGVEYTCSGSISSRAKSKKQKTVFYKSSNPRICYVNDGSSKFHTIFFLLGLFTLFFPFIPKEVFSNFIKTE